MTDTMPVTDAPKPAEGNVEPPVTPAEPTPKPEAPVEGADALGDAGKKALDAMKAERNSAKAEAKKLADDFAALKAKVEGKEAEHAAEQKARELEQAALGKANERILKAEVRAAAAAKLADPADALRFIDLSSFEVGDDGDVNADDIAQAIDDLVKDKPYLAAQGGKRFQGSADGGTRNGSGPASQLSRSDLEGMTPEAIVTAKAEGRLNDALGIKS